ncbi:6-phosphofructokinase [Imperialibacter roseus]|uniref:ATP-dependent 6-phosphofructokinase n=1 Tax=Imperialibacter roseus TaxID=1324217 RepID=A0ABZ0IIX0_9BACT|nr:6-phosphofructokinase [Imperialibacter roseus]WOK04980.1 6-phosphofructokinase [Imperialibacter roseus]|tara:strand:+ start:2465 stop:3436 length:972 start_codon:yes stop_codon:yes gene_type:complete
MKKIAVFTSGGDAPGMNACIRSVVRSALYHELEIYGIKYGYNGMIEGDIYKMKSYSVSNIVQRGGTILKSARSKDFMTKEGRKKAYEQLSSRGIEGLIAIGGDGTFTGANIFFEEYGIPVVGAPGTIDNDLFGSDYTIGFDTAVNTALEAIDKIRDTAMSHDRVFFIEVMGRHSGYIAIQSGIGGGAELVMVPETSTTINEVINALQKGKDAQKTSSIVVVAEGGEEGNAHEIAAKVAPHLPKADIRVSTLGHIQRGGNPTAFDRILASRLGLAAVEGLLNGEKNVMVGIIDKEVVYTNLKIAISKSKPLDQDLIRLVEILSI